MHCHASCTFQNGALCDQYDQVGGEHICKTLFKHCNICSLGLCEVVITMKGGWNGGILHLWSQLISLTSFNQAHQGRGFSLSLCFKDVKVIYLCDSSLL